MICLIVAVAASGVLMCGAEAPAMRRVMLPAIIAATLAWVEPARATPPPFICPEYLPNDAARDNNMVDFIQQMAKKYPGGITISELATERVKMLEAHHCTETLRNIRNNTR